MTVRIQEIITLRKSKKELYIALLKKGLNSLTETEKELLSQLSIDDDIILQLTNGNILK